MKNFLAAICLLTAFQILTFGQKSEISTREMDRVNWMEFKEFIPSKINTVLLPTGTLEPHGVINNGADNTAPTAMAKTIAQRTNAMIAPTLPYGITGSMEAYPARFRSPKRRIARSSNRLLKVWRKTVLKISSFSTVTAAGRPPFCNRSRRKLRLREKFGRLS